MQANAGTTTIAIPVYNGEAFLGEAIDSVMAQTHIPSEILVFDNASTDTSRQIAEERLGADAIRAASTNGGASWNFTRAVEESSGEYFAWLAADDRLAPGFLSRGVAALEAAPSVAACLPAVRFIDLEGREVGYQRDPELADDRPRVRLRSFLRRYRWTESYCLYRRDALLRSPMFGAEFAADVILTWWFLLRGPLVVLDEPLLEYRVYPSKSDDDMAESLTPGAPRVRWRKMRMWWALWRETAASDLPPPLRRVARRELLTALGSRPWLEHNLVDVRAAFNRGPAARTTGASAS